MYNAKQAPLSTHHGKIPTATNQLNSACTVCRRLEKPPVVYNNHSISQCPSISRHSALIQCSKEDQLTILKDAIKMVLDKQEEDILQGPITPSS